MNMTTLKNPLELRGRPRKHFEVQLPQLNTDYMNKVWDGRGRPLFSKNAEPARTRGRPSGEEAIKTLFEKIEKMILKAKEE